MFISCRPKCLLVLILLLGITAPAYAQDGDSLLTRLKYRDPAEATLKSFLIAGGGHLYAGEENTGLALLGIGLGAPTAGSIISVSSTRRNCTETGCREVVNYVPTYVGVLVGLAAWTYGIVDADDAARRINRKNDISLSLGAVQPGRHRAIVTLTLTL